MPSLQTLDGQNLTIDTKDGLSINGAKILTSRGYDGGIVYVINQVLLPSEVEAGRGLVEVAEMLPLKKFIENINSAGLVERLNGQGLLGIESLAEGPFTIFAPNDEAFANVSTETLKTISSKDNGMIRLLSYHIVESKALQNLTNPTSVKTMEGSSLGVDPKQGLVGGANVIDSMRYDNGIIYVIDRVLIPLKLSI